MWSLFSLLVNKDLESYRLDVEEACAIINLLFFCSPDFLRAILEVDPRILNYKIISTLMSSTLAIYIIKHHLLIRQMNIGDRMKIMLDSRKHRSEEISAEIISTNLASPRPLVSPVSLHPSLGHLRAPHFDSQFEPLNMASER